MLISKAPVVSIKEIQKGIYLLEAHCPKIAAQIKPGQFCNIKITELTSPLLRRPFSICNVKGENMFFMFNIFGEGTKLLSRKHIGDTIDILAPLGNGFTIEGDYDHAVIVAGGLGAAPFPYLTNALAGKNISTFIGGRSANDIIQYGMKNIQIATDDGSIGFKGNVVELLKTKVDQLKKGKIRIFSCGPNPMLRALKEFCIENDFECQASTECAMACGFGICQGCPIETTQKDQYKLVCKDGPVFDVRDVII